MFSFTGHGDYYFNFFHTQNSHFTPLNEKFLPPLAKIGTFVTQMQIKFYALNSQILCLHVCAGEN